MVQLQTKRKVNCSNSSIKRLKVKNNIRFGGENLPILTASDMIDENEMVTENVRKYQCFLISVWKCE